MKLTALLATDLRGGIGHQGKLPWPKMSRDLQRFKAATMGRLCVVGRKTAEGLPPLPGRALLIASRGGPPAFQKTIRGPALGVIPDLDRFNPTDLRLEDWSHDEVMVIGGAEVFRAMLPRCDRLLLTVVHGEWPADVRFERPTEGFERLSVETFDPDPHTPARLTFSEWVRR